MTLRLWLVAAVVLAAGSCVGRITVQPAQPICPAFLMPPDLARCRLWA